VAFAAFELYALQRPGAERDYPPGQIAKAEAWWNELDEETREIFIQDIIDVFPGEKRGCTLADIRGLLARYENVGEVELRTNLRRFLEAVIPEAEKAGVRLAIHPDDPPFALLGLPRIVSRAEDIAEILGMVDLPANGLCFCTGSLGAREDNDLVEIVRRFAPRIHAAHLRSTHRLPDGSFYEANHLEGSVDMPQVMRALLSEQDRRIAEGRADWRLIFRPDHGHTMMDDLAKPAGITPGYSAIGRMRGLAELRGLMVGLRHSLPPPARS
jgi:mannonate dehydratase